MKRISLLVCLLASVCTNARAVTVTYGPTDSPSKINTCNPGDIFYMLDKSSLVNVTQTVQGVLFIVADNAQITIKNCKLNFANINAKLGQQQIGAIYIGNGMHDSHIDNNTITSVTDLTGIFGYPGNNNTFNNNTFDYVWEPMHFVSDCSNTQINNNVITHATRIGIELQHGMTNLTVNNNWMQYWLPFVTNGTDNHMGISCATGGSTKSPFGGQGHNILINGNTIIQEAQVDIWAKSAIEAMGDGKIVNNRLIGWGTGILNGGFAPGFSTSGNTVYATGGNFSGPDNCSWPIKKLVSTDGSVLPLSAAPVLTPPVAGSPTPVPPTPVPPVPVPPTPAPVLPPAPTGLTLAAKPDGVYANCNAVGGAASYIWTWVPTHGTASQGGVVHSTCPEAVLAVPANWQVNVTVAVITSAGTSAASAPVQTQMLATAER